MAAVDFNTPHEGPDDLTVADPVEGMEAVSDLRGKVFELADPALNVPSFMRRVLLPYAPAWGGLQRLLG